MAALRRGWLFTVVWVVLFVVFTLVAWKVREQILLTQGRVQLVWTWVLGLGVIACAFGGLMSQGLMRLTECISGATSGGYKEKEVPKSLSGVLTGLVESTFFCVGVAAALPGAITAMVGWLALKMSAHWQLFKEQGDWTRLNRAILGGLCSAFFATLGGLVCTNPSVQGFLALSLPAPPASQLSVTTTSTAGAGGVGGQPQPPQQGNWISSETRAALVGAVVAAILALAGIVAAEPLICAILGPTLEAAFVKSGGSIIDTPTTSSGDRPLKYFRVRVVNTGRRVAKNCRAYLTRVERRSDGGKFVSAEYSDSVPLPWAYRVDNDKQVAIDIPRSVPHFVDVVFVGAACESTFRGFHLAAAFRPEKYAQLLADGTAYRITIVVTSDEGALAEEVVELEYAGSWENATGKPV